MWNEEFPEAVADLLADLGCREAEWARHWVAQRLAAAGAERGLTPYGHT
ncbi:hypothetical protein [Amycolatopsis sp. NPDC004625]